MRLEDIGFYTLSDNRAENVSLHSPLWRCELLITSRCNFKCPYCRGTDRAADISFEHATDVVRLWCDEGLKNIRFSGGEPTTVKWLPGIVEYAKSKGVERIAISTNGSASTEYYLNLLKKGVNDFSISLDACCSSFGDKMAGVSGVWQTVVDNIKELSKHAYVTTGCVFDEKNIEQSVQTVVLAHELGVSDIRILTAAQYNKSLSFVNQIPNHIVEQHPVLKYRVNNFKKGRNVRGLIEHDNHRCPLVLDDMAIKGSHHYPCIIYMRELGSPIGMVSDDMRFERFVWFVNHDCFEDEICRNNCLDVCIDYNNKVREAQREKTCNE
jgi:MoaA/NifB/PqqE/SkfB family radical SAM enzyme